jgi:methanogenic corrinoid protein MtbC1
MSTATRGTGVAEHAERLWDAVTTGDEHAAGDTVVRALGDGTDPESVLLDVIAAVQRRVGREWAANRLTVAQEHAATAINDRVIATFGYLVRRPEPHLGRITVACVDGEWHAMPARLLAEVLRLRGFGVDYLGAQVPAQHLVAHLHRTGPDAVALSGSLATRLPTAHATITACQAAATPVIAGGAAFGPDGRTPGCWVPKHGRRTRGRPPTGWPSRSPGRTVLISCRGLIAARGPSAAGARQPLDDLPHLADQEYTLVTRSSGRLVKTVLAGLEERIPAMRAYTDLQRQYTAEDLAHIVEYLATGLLRTARTHLAEPAAGSERPA